MKRLAYLGALSLLSILALLSTWTAGAQQPDDDGTETVIVRRDGRSLPTKTLKEAPDPDAGRPARAGSLIVAFRSGAGQGERDSARQLAGALTSEPLYLPNTVRMQVPEALTAQALAFLRRLPSVEYAEPDLILRAVLTPNDPRFGEQWGMTKINAPQAWDTTTGATSVRVAILDCGIYHPGSSTFVAPDGQVGHPDLRDDKVVADANFSTSGNSDDFCNHGTHVAGITAANTNNAIGVAGVGFNTKLVNVKVLGDNGSGSASSVINGILWAAGCSSGGSCGARRAEVINMSLGAGGTCSWSMQNAINLAWGQGLVVVAAAGNSNTSSAFWPAVCNNVVAVSASTSTDAKASFSNFGSWVDVAAPGVSILSTDYVGGYASFNGTSMASPHVAGLAALVWTTPYNTGNAAVVNRIFQTANKSALAGSTQGRIDAAAAVGAAPTPPAAPSGLTATAVSSSQIDLAWTDNASNETGFKIERSPDGATFTEIATVGANATSFQNSGLNASTTYYYRVRATNGAGDSAYSNTASATTQAAPTPPAAPSGLTATAVSSSQIDLAWTDPATNETGFKIERSPDGATFTQIATVGTDVTSFQNTGLDASTIYYYRVRATNAAGDSAYSNTANATTLAPPPGPTSTGFQGPTANGATGGGDGNGYEVNPANAHSNDGVFAVDNNSGSGFGSSCTSASKDKHIFRDYGFALPGGAAILGIEVRLDARADSASSSPRICVQLSWDGGATWTAAKQTATLTTSEATYILGGAADTWGRTWGAGDFSNANFRVRVIDVSSSSSRDFFLDWIAVNVHYQ